MATLAIQLAALTDVGRVREANEDTHVARVLSLPERSPLGVRAAMAVADGMGGHAAGEVASQTAVNALTKVLLGSSGNRPPMASIGQLADYVVDTVRWINEEVCALASSGEGSKPGTTLSAWVVRDDCFVIAHVGDSRVYLLRDGRLDQFTDDHSYVAAQVRAGTMTEAMARQSPFRGQLTRCLGSTPAVEVDVRSGELREGDRWLACSDGLSEYLDSEEIAAILASEADPARACRRLVDVALQRGGADNITVTVADVGARGARQGRPLPEHLAATAEVPVAPLPPALLPSRHRAGHGWRPWLIGVPAAILVGCGVAQFLRPTEPCKPAPTASPPTAPADPPASASLEVTILADPENAYAVRIEGGKGRLTVESFSYLPALDANVWSISGLTVKAAEQKWRLGPDGLPLDLARPATRLLSVGDHALNSGDEPVATLTVRP